MRFMAITLNPPMIVMQYYSYGSLFGLLQVRLLSNQWCKQRIKCLQSAKLGFQGKVFLEESMIGTAVSFILCRCIMRIPSFTSNHQSQIIIVVVVVVCQLVESTKRRPQITS
jgi:hypothetical protein